MDLDFSDERNAGMGRSIPATMVRHTLTIGQTSRSWSFRQCFYLLSDLWRAPQARPGMSFCLLVNGGMSIGNENDQVS